jgi:signal peptidase II
MRLRAALWLTAGVVALDQLTKAWIVSTYPLGNELEIIPGLFRLVHARNRGIAFGILGASGPTIQLALLIVVVGIVVFVAWQLRHAGGDGFAGVGLALVLGGAIGNIVDRVLRGEVVDFLDFYLVTGGSEHHWPAFNVADSAISVGACCVILAEVLAHMKEKRASSPD